MKNRALRRALPKFFDVDPRRQQIKQDMSTIHVTAANPLHRSHVKLLRHTIFPKPCFNKRRRSVPWLHTPPTRTQVYAACGSLTPGLKISRFAALLERSPDTLAQLSRQDQVSRRQQRTQKAAAAAAAAAADEDRDENAVQHQEQGSAVGKDETGVGRGGAGGGDVVAADGPASPVLIFVAGDRSQVRRERTVDRPWSFFFFQSFEVRHPVVNLALFCLIWSTAACRYNFRHLEDTSIYTHEAKALNPRDAFSIAFCGLGCVDLFVLLEQLRRWARAAHVLACSVAC